MVREMNPKQPALDERKLLESEWRALRNPDSGRFDPRYPLGRDSTCYAWEELLRAKLAEFGMDL